MANRRSNRSELNRRELLIHGAAGAAALLLSSACRAPRPGHPGDAGATADPGDAFPLAELTVAELAASMQRGERTARQLTELYLARIEALDRRGPRLGAVLETNPDALRIADELDGERRTKGPRGPLHGIPVLVKDNLDTGDRMTTTAGSLVLEGTRALRDSTVVARLRAAGAVILGKASLSEWANFRSTRSFSGWSGRGGQCRNPYALDRSPCGSSAGSGVALAANLCAVAVGTETDGSIVCPSSTSALVGIKPTVGLVSRAGIIPISHSQDTAGPMARTVADAAALLAAMVGADPTDPRDPATRAAAGRTADYLAALDPDGLRGARIGVARKYFGFHPGVDALLETAIAVMKQQGAIIIDPVDLSDLSDLGDNEMEVLCYEFKAGLAAYLAERGPDTKVRTLADVIAANRRLADRELAFFGQEIFERAQAKGTLDDEAYKQARATCVRLARTEGIDATMDRHQLDALLAPTNAPAWTVDPISGDHFIGGSSTPAAVAGTPSITVPAGQIHGLPVGLSLFGRAFTEATLIRLAYSYEQASRARKPPTFAATLTLGL
jgi:amidase